jgi:hypothetical protein
MSLPKSMDFAIITKAGKEEQAAKSEITFQKR